MAKKKETKTADTPVDQTHVLLGPGGDILAEMPASERLTRLQALLAQWLRMENVVVLLGAGASCSQDGPTMSELEDWVLRNARELCANSPDLKPVLPIVESRLDGDTGKKKTAFSFERWLSVLANALFVVGSDDSPVAAISFKGLDSDQKPGNATVPLKSLEEFIRVIGRLVALRCTLSLTGITEDKVSPHHALIAKLVARDPSFGRAHVFTINYDTLVEQALDALGVRYTDGFVGTVERRFDSSAYGLDVYYPGEVAEGRVRRFDKFLHLYKPHGSIQWRRRTDGTITQVGVSPKQDFKAWEREGTEDKLGKLNQLFGDDSDPVCILPTEAKFVQTLGMPYSHLLRAFQQRLEVPQTFFLVVGYGFGDEHINAIINDSMTNPGLVMLAVDPFGGEALKKRIAAYQQAGERAFLLHGIRSDSKPRYATFTDFACDLLPHVKWIDDYVRLRKTERSLQQLDLRNGQGDDDSHDE